MSTVVQLTLTCKVTLEAFCTLNRQSQVAMSVDTVNIDNDQKDDAEEIETTDKVKPNENKLIIHYTHEKRFQSFKRDTHKIYEDIFKKSSAMELKMIVGNRNRQDAKHELIRKRPNQAILQNQPIKVRPRRTKTISTKN